MIWKWVWLWLGLMGMLAPAQASDEITTALKGFNAHARYPIPELSDNQLEKLEQGRLVRIREVPKDSSQPQRGIGLRILDQQRAVLWAGMTDAHLVSKAMASEVQLPKDGLGERWYQRLWLPWPFAQRHWVIDVEDVPEVAAGTEGKAWEHCWALTEGGEGLAQSLIASGAVQDIEPSDAAGFVYVPVNRGAYFAITLSGDRTLWGFHASTVIGGNVSDSLVAKYTMMQLKGLFEEIAERGRQAQQHYAAGHEPLVGGDGLPLPFFPAK